MEHLNKVWSSCWFYLYMFPGVGTWLLMPCQSLSHTGRHKGAQLQLHPPFCHNCTMCKQEQINLSKFFLPVQQWHEIWVSGSVSCTCVTCNSSMCFHFSCESGQPLPKIHFQTYFIVSKQHKIQHKRRIAVILTTFIGGTLSSYNYLHNLPW